MRREMSKNILIKNACVITGCGEVFPDGFVLIRDGKIFAVGRATHNAVRATVIDANGRYVLPGFINPHMHAYSALARGIPVPRMTSFGEILKNLWWKLDSVLTLEDIYVSALLCAADSIRSGVTTVFDHHASYGAIQNSLATISDAFAKFGLRSCLSYEISDRAGKKARDEAVKENALWLENVLSITKKNTEFLQRGMVGLHASMTLSDESLKMARELMDTYNVGAHVHVSEGTEDNIITQKKFHTSPAARFVRNKILDPGSIAAHCVHVDDKDISMLKKSGTFVVHNPMSNFNNGVGIAPVQKMFAKGIPIAVGTDGMSAGVSDDVRLASVLHGIDLKDIAPQIASAIFAQDIGVIRKGAAADVIISDAIPPTPVTAENARLHVLYGAMTAPVHTTIIAGEIVMKDFVIKGVDEMELAAHARKLVKGLWKRF